MIRILNKTRKVSNILISIIITGFINFSNLDTNYKCPQKSCARPFIDGVRKKGKKAIAHFKGLILTSIREQTQSKI